MAVNDCYFLGNVAADGGAIENQGAMTLTGCTFSENIVGPPTESTKPMQDNGGAIDNHGTLSISGCNFNSDQTVVDSPVQKTAGGDVANFGTLTVIGSSFGGITVGPEGDGGSIANFGNASVAS